MKRVLMLMLLVTTVCKSFALEPVEWKHSIKKIAVNTYAVSITATIKKGWHLYAQKQPTDAIAFPTTFAFSKNPLIVLSGNVREAGKLETFKDELIGVTQYHYSSRVDFVQIIKLKTKVKTNITAILLIQELKIEGCG